MRNVLTIDLSSVRVYEMFAAVIEIAEWSLMNDAVLLRSLLSTDTGEQSLSGHDLPEVWVGDVGSTSSSYAGRRKILLHGVSI